MFHIYLIFLRAIRNLSQLVIRHRKYSEKNLDPVNTDGQLLTILDFIQDFEQIVTEYDEEMAKKGARNSAKSYQPKKNVEYTEITESFLILNEEDY